MFWATHSGTWITFLVVEKKKSAPSTLAMTLSSYMPPLLPVREDGLFTERTYCFERAIIKFLGRNNLQCEFERWASVDGRRQRLRNKILRGEFLYSYSFFKPGMKRSNRIGRWQGTCLTDSKSKYIHGLRGGVMNVGECWG